nr:MAG TPA: hypothetical protein [Microviridae sp.]
MLKVFALSAYLSFFLRYKDKKSIVNKVLIDC